MSSVLGPEHWVMVFYGICHSLLAKLTLCPRQYRISWCLNMAGVSSRSVKATAAPRRDYVAVGLQSTFGHLIHLVAI